MSRARTAISTLAVVDAALIVTAGGWCLARGDVANAISALLFVLFPAVALVILRARRATAVAATFAVSSLLYALQKLSDNVVTVGRADDWPSPVIRGAAWISNVAWFPSLFLLVTIALLRFPDGRLLSRRWRVVEWITGGALLVWMIGISAAAATVPVDVLVTAVEPLPPPGTTRLLFEVSQPAFLVLVGCMFASLGSLFARRRRGGPVERAQIRWVLAAAATAVVVDLSLAAHGFVTGNTPFWLQNLGEGVGFGLIAIATGVAITRYKLYEIDRLVSRTVTYALVLVALAALYVGVLVALAQLVPADLGQLGVAAATLVVSIVAVPLTRRVRHTVDHRFNRSRFDAERVVTAFATRLRARPERGDVPADLIAVVHRTVQPAHATVWLVK